LLTKSAAKLKGSGKMRVWGLTWLVLAAWLLVLGGCWPAEAQKTSKAGNPIVSVRLNQTVVQAEVVASLEKIYLGLGGRQHLAPGTGMLFIMPTLEVQHFCMRGMLIPIDIIWIAHDRIIGFHKNLSPNDPGTFTSPAPADVVLEVPAGFVGSAGLRVGDRVQRLR
jgi:uncharacterized membrane protein (UPF0127 family)